MFGEKLFSPIFKQIDHLFFQKWDFDSLVIPIRVLRMHAHQIESRHCFPVFLLQNGFIRIQLERIVPEIRIGQMPNTIRDGASSVIV